MPKMKTHSGAKKRFRLTGTGKVVHKRAGKTHLMERKSSAQVRRVEGMAVMANKGDAAKARKLLGK